MANFLKIFLIGAILPALALACSPKKVAVNAIGNAISGGSSVYLSDNDPDLVREAIPFGLKTYESLLEVSPEHRGLLLSAASGFTSYAYLLSEKADEIENYNYRRARDLRERAANLYLRGRAYAFRGLNLETPDFHQRLLEDPDGALAQVQEKDVAFLYWGGASWAGALSTQKGDTDLIAGLPYAGAMVKRVLELDEGFNEGAAYDFMVSYEGNRPNGDPEKAREYFRKALEYSDGKRASTYLALAESVVIPQQDVAEFRSLVDAALAIDPEASPDIRLVNILAQERAKRLKENISDYFLVVDAE